MLAVLLLRGPQTVGELRTRSERLYAFSSIEDVEFALGELAERELVERLPRRPGEREERWAQLLGATAGPEPAAPVEQRGDLEERVARIEQQLAELLERLDA